MSDIFISLKKEFNQVNEVNKFLKWTDAHKSFSEVKNGIFWSISRMDNPDIWGPAFDSKSNVKVILNGRIALKNEEWESSKNITHISGGLACKYILNKWNEKKFDAIKDLDGAFTVVIISFSDKKINIWTDRLGLMPLYKDEDSNYISSHPDLISKISALNHKNLTIDKDTIAEFIKTGTATFPYTYWKEVKQISSGNNLCIDMSKSPNTIANREYFSIQDFSGPYITSRKKIVKLLTKAILSSVKKRTLPILGKTAVLLSAGVDSRAALFSMDDPSEAHAITLYDEENAELINAKKLAKAASCKQKSIKRSADYYLKHADQSVKISGGMWSIDSAHYTGIISTLQESENILTGCYFDYLLKGLAYDRKEYKIFGRHLPLFKFTDHSDDWYQPHFKINQSYEESISHRVKNLYDKFKNAKGDPRASKEYLRVIPLSREADVSGRAILRRTCGHDYFIADNEIVSLISRIHPDEKLNGIAFSQAVANIQPKEAQKILNNNYSSPLNASEISRVLHFLKNSFKRKILSLKSKPTISKESIATPGSWPNMTAVISKSDICLEWLNNLPCQHSKIIFDILDNDEKSWTIDEWKNHPLLFLRVFTVSKWIKINENIL